MKQGKLKNGFKFEIDENVLDDMELLDDMAEAEGENPLKISAVIVRVLGKEQRKRLYDSLRGEDGRVHIEDATAAFTEILKIAGEEDGKNS